MWELGWGTVDELLRVVSVLRERIVQHRVALRTNETLTRYALIDPLLAALGWDTADPSVVVPEFSPEKGRADYALFARPDGGSPKPDVIVEAKKLDEDLREAASQALGYSMHDGFEYFVVTDGNKWQLYKTLHPGDINAKRLVSFELHDSAMADVCRSALALWREGFAEGTVRAAPALGAATDAAASPVPSDSAHRPAQPSVAPPHAVSASEQSEVDWVSLPGLVPAKGAKPLDIRLPSGAVVATPSWRNLMIEVVRYVAANLSGDLPIFSGKKHLVASQPIHPDGEPFRAHGAVAGLFVNLNYSAADILRHCRTIANKGGADPRLFGVRMAP